MTLLDKNFFVRTGSIAVLVPVVLGVLYKGAPFSQLVMVGVTVVMLYEYVSITKTLRPRFLWLAGGICYIAIPFIYLIYVTVTDPNPFEATLALLSLVWAIDVGAYLTGRIMGGPLLAPAISPKKTWSGFVGGSFIGAFVFIAISHNFGVFPYMTLPFVFVLTCAAQGGDLLESWVKRMSGVKDSGHIIPGHGGLLDRLDSLLAVLWVVLILNLF